MILASLQKESRTESKTEREKLEIKQCYRVKEEPFGKLISLKTIWFRLINTDPRLTIDRPFFGLVKIADNSLGFIKLKNEGKNHQHLYYIEITGE